MYVSLICNPDDFKPRTRIRIPPSLLQRLSDSPSLDLSNYIFEIKFVFPRFDPPVLVNEYGNICYEDEYGNISYEGEYPDETAEKFYFVVDGNSALLTENGLYLKASHGGEVFRLNTAARESGHCCIQKSCHLDGEFGFLGRCDIIAVNKTTMKIASLVDVFRVDCLSTEHLDNGSIHFKSIYNNFDAYEKGQGNDQIRILSTFEALMTAEHIEFRMKYCLHHDYIGNRRDDPQYDNRLLEIILEELD